MSRFGLLFWIGAFFVWIIYLRMQKEAEAAKNSTNPKASEAKKT